MMERFIFYRDLIHSDPSNHPEDKSHHGPRSFHQSQTSNQTPKDYRSKTDSVELCKPLPSRTKTDSVELCEPLPSGTKTGENGAENISPSQELEPAAVKLREPPPPGEKPMSTNL
ncbi:hypothetical protein DY000_02064117 [Brassica cretica]|uniref:Uncharacterized protein n=1 Tax=Brassica cretica TaxID=69181 RepID=A0ABQ7AWW7_BRACR|nr:hypothetical protein DY000_02064117 [Brassica cretica]